MATPKLLEQCAEAFARCEDARGHRLFDAALASVEPLIAQTMRMHLTGAMFADHREDAAQRARLSIWKAVTTGHVPSVQLHAQRAAIDVYRSLDRYSKHHDQLVQVDSEHTVDNEWDYHAHAQLEATPDHADEIVDRLGGAAEATVRVTAVRARITGRAHLVAITDAMAAGDTTSFQIADRIGKPDGTVRNHIVELRRELADLEPAA